MEDDLGWKYYEQHPDKIPDIVLRLSADYMEYDENTESTLSETTDSTQKAAVDIAWDNTKLMSYLNSSDYRKVNTDCGTVYIRNLEEYKNVLR